MFIQYARFSCPVLSHLQFRRQISEKPSKIICHGIPYSGGQAVTFYQADRRTEGRRDKHEDAKRPLSQFCESA